LSGNAPDDVPDYALSVAAFWKIAIGLTGKTIRSSGRSGVACVPGLHNDFEVLQFASK